MGQALLNQRTSASPGYITSRSNRDKTFKKFLHKP
jgi:hypothetical protein